MSTSIDQAFIGDYNADVHLVFQREGSMLRAGVFTKDNIVGSTAYFEKLGTGTATTKSRHGEITPMNATHTQPSATLVDFYAGDFVDLPRPISTLEWLMQDRALTRSGARSMIRSQPY